MMSTSRIGTRPTKSSMLQVVAIDVITRIPNKVETLVVNLVGRGHMV
jgi:hypothetical protein